MPEFAQCPNCQMRVILQDDKICPSCRVHFDKAPAAREETLVKARKAAVGRLKSVNVAIGIFILLWMLFLVPLGLLARVVVNDVLNMPESDLTYQGKRLLAHILSAALAFLIIRRLWPIKEGNH